MSNQSSSVFSNVKYVLVAGGGIGVPQLNIPLYLTAKHRDEAADVAETLSKAGYYSFTVYDVSTEDHKFDCAINVDIPKPVAYIARSTGQV